MSGYTAMGSSPRPRPRKDPRAVYVAAGSSEIPRAQSVMNEIRKMGFTITHDWTVPVLKYGPMGAPPDVLREEAAHDADGVATAALFVLLAPAGPSTGAWWELGLAMAQGTPVLMSGESRCIFTRLLDPAFCYTCDDDLLCELGLQMSLIDEAESRDR
jgi:hypothetical protein